MIINPGEQVSNKLIRLKEILKDLKKIAVAYSGGVDSAFLLKIAYDIPGIDTIGIYVDSPLQPEREKREAIETAKHIHADIVVININPLENPSFRKNPVNRCYFCKGLIFDKILKTAVLNGFSNIVDGSNHDDAKDYRPGKKALAERKIRSPLQEAGLTKEDIRILSKKEGLPTWNKDAYACLATRIPYGTEISTQYLKQVDKTEEILLLKGYRYVRARHFGDEVRIEVQSDQVQKLQEEMKNPDIYKSILDSGFSKIFIEPQGYRQGNLNKPPKM